MRKVQNTSRTSLTALLFWISLGMAQHPGVVLGQSLPDVFLGMQVNVLLIDSRRALIVDANPRALEFYGYTRDELIGQSIGFVNTDSVETTLQNIQRAEALKQTHFLFTHRLANGDHRIVEIHTSPITADDQDLLVSIVIDVTDREQNEQNLRESQAQLQRAEEIARIGHWEFDLNQNLVHGSHGAYQIYGISSRELTIAQVQQIPLTEYRAALDQALENLIERNIPYFVEYKIQRPIDGQIRTIRSRASYDPLTNRVFGTIQDITADVARQQSQLLAARTSIVFFLTTSLLLLVGVILVWRQNRIKRLQNDRITQLLQEKELLLKEVHHRIKNHMGSAISLLELQSDQAQELDPQVSEKIQRVLSTASTRLTSMMLIYDKLYKSESYTAGSSKLYLESLSKELVNYLRNSKEITLETNIIDVQLDPKVLMSLGMIVNELITNSMKYAFYDQSSGLIQISLFTQKESLILEVKDNGIGVNLEEHSLGQSTGFGWTLVQLTIEQLQGQYALLDQKGFGIRIELPRE